MKGRSPFYNRGGCITHYGMGVTLRGQWSTKWWGRGEGMGNAVGGGGEMVWKEVETWSAEECEGVG